MPYTYNATCSGCGYRQFDFLTHLSRWAYLFPDGKVQRILAKAAWCETCGQVVHAEDVPSIEELKERAVHFPWYEWNLEWLLAWRAARCSLGKCLACGSDKVTLFRDVSRQEKRAPHPVCGGLLSLLIARHVSVATPVVHDLYSPEGMPLGRQMELA